MAAAVVAVMYWVDNPIWLAGTLSITAMAAFSTFFVNLSLAWEYIFGLLFIWAGIASVIMALKFGKWVATIGAVIRVLLMAFFTLTVLIYAGEHGRRWMSPISRVLAVHDDTSGAGVTIRTSCLCWASNSASTPPS